METQSVANYQPSNLIGRLGSISFLSFWATGLDLEGPQDFYATCRILLTSSRFLKMCLTRLLCREFATAFAPDRRKLTSRLMTLISILQDPLLLTSFGAYCTRPSRHHSIDCRRLVCQIHVRKDILYTKTTLVDQKPRLFLTHLPRWNTHCEHAPRPSATYQFYFPFPLWVHKYC